MRTSKSPGSTSGSVSQRHRHGHGRARAPAHRPRRGDRAVAGGLVEVEEHALAALLLPPADGRLLRAAGRATRRAIAITACRTAMKSHSGRIRANTWIPRPPEVFGQPTSPASSSTSCSTAGHRRRRRRSRCRAAGRGRCAARRGGRGRPGGPATGGSRTCPCSPPTTITAGSVGHSDCAVRPLGKVTRGRLDVVRGALGQPLGVERLAVHAVGVALEVGRPLAQHAQQRLGHGPVVLHHLALGDPALGEVDPVGAGQADLAVAVRAGDGEQHRRLGRHAAARYRLPSAVPERHEPDGAAGHRAGCRRPGRASPAGRSARFDDELVGLDPEDPEAQAFAAHLDRMQRQRPAFTVEGYLDGVTDFADSANRAQGGRRWAAVLVVCAAGRGGLPGVGRADVRAPTWL